MQTKKLITWSSFLFYALASLYLIDTFFKGHEITWTFALYVLNRIMVLIFGFEFIRRRSMHDFTDVTPEWKNSLYLLLGMMLLHIPVLTFYVGFLGSNTYEFEVWHLFFGPYLWKSFLLLLQSIVIMALFRTIWYLNASFHKNRKKIILVGSVIVFTTCLIGFSFIGYNHVKVGDDYFDYSDPPETFQELIAHQGLSGKFIYVDFWHSGCKPCLIEMEQSKAFKSSLSAQQQEGIEYLYIGVDRSNPGEKALQMHWINKLEVTGRHHFISRDQFRTWWDELKAHEGQQPFFPYHLWVSPNGEILVRDAPGPNRQMMEIIDDSFLDKPYH